MAIRDYIERYAYPVKVRGLLDTFEDILKFYNLAVIYAIAIEEAIKNLTAT